MKKSFAIVVSLVMLFGLMAVPAQAATEEEIEDSIVAGIDWLASVQNGDGSWGGYEYVGHTGLALLKLEDRAFELGYDSPFNPGYAYSSNVTAGLNYLYSQAHNISIGMQPAGDPDTNGNGEGIYFSDSYHVSYGTGIALMALAGTRDPSIVVPALGSPIDGMTLGDVVQDTVDFLAWSQGDTGWWRGGWGYGGSADEGWADNSNSGYVVLGLDFAESATYMFNANIPTFVKDELNIWIDYIQNDVDGDPDDGGSGYIDPVGWVNILKTGNLIYQMAFYGDSPATQRVIDAVDYIERHWNDPNSDPGFRPHHYQSMFCVMKGLTRMGIDEITVGGSPVDWFDELSTIIVDSQNLDGSWPVDYWGDQILSTAWALLTLERFVPPPPVPIEVSKHWSYTNVCFEKDNDNDGEFNEDPVNFEIDGVTPIDDDGDGLYNEDDVDCPMGTYLGDELPMAGDNYVLEAVIHPRNDKVKSYNPGQYYAVSTVNVTSDVEVLTIEEDWSDCYNISALNPPSGGGSVVIVQVGPGDTVAYQIFDATSDAISINATACTATATLEDVAAGTIIYMYVKFGPALKGQSWEGPYGPCVNYNRASVVEEPAVPEDWIEASANLTLVAKD
jgi:hypothetical protein